MSLKHPMLNNWIFALLMVAVISGMVSFVVYIREIAWILVNGGALIVFVLSLVVIFVLWYCGDDE